MDTVTLVASIVLAVVTTLTTAGVAWMWRLYFGPENPAPRSRFLLVLCVKSTLIMFALWVLSWLASRRLAGEPSLGEMGGLILVGVILILSSAHLITIGYLFGLRKLRRRREGKPSPPPFSMKD